MHQLSGCAELATRKNGKARSRYHEPQRGRTMGGTSRQDPGGDPWGVVPKTAGTTQEMEQGDPTTRTPKKLEDRNQPAKRGLMSETN